MTLQTKTTKKSLSVIVLAGGKGTRMKSSKPKVLHEIAGLPLVSWVLKAAESLGAEHKALVLGHEKERFLALKDKFSGLHMVLQELQRGTGDAVASAACVFEEVLIPNYASKVILSSSGAVKSEWTLVLAADAPCIDHKVLSQFFEELSASGKQLGVIGMIPDSPKGYGRLITEKKQGEGLSLQKIVEEKDANDLEKKVSICNSGVILCKTNYLFELLSRLTQNNKQNEFYLTDIFALAKQEGKESLVFVADCYEDFLGVNDRGQLSEAESWMLKKIRAHWMKEGVTIRLPESVYIGADVTFGRDVEVFGPAVLRGKRHVEDGSSVGPFVVLD